MTDWGLSARLWTKTAVENIDPDFDKAWKHEHPAVDKYVTMGWAWLGHANSLLTEASRDPAYAGQFDVSRDIAALGAKVDQYVYVLTQLGNAGFGMQNVAAAAWAGAVSGLGDGFANIKRLADKAGEAAEKVIDATNEGAGTVKKFSKTITLALVGIGVLTLGLLAWAATRKVGG